MGGWVGKAQRNYAANLEVLSLAAKNGADAATLAALKVRLANLENPSANAAPTPATGIDNLFVNSDHDHSVLSYTGAGANDEDYRWFRGVDPATPVKTAATNPLWNRDEGWLDWSITTDADDLSYNFDKRLIRPGQSLYLMFNARLKDGLSGAGLTLEAGIWDKTVGIANWIGASVSGGAGSATINAVKVGPGVAATNYTYVVVAQTDRNEIVVSLPKTVMGAAALTTTDYNQISWTLTGGVLTYRIYRTGPNPGLIGIVSSGSTTFNDVGVLIQANAPIPVPAATLAKTTITNFGTGLSSVWKTIRLTIRIPRNYNFSLTGSDKQWFRMGLRGTSVNSIQIDRMGLSLTPGVWSPSPEDRQSVGDVVITPTGDGEQGGVGVDFEHTGGWWDFSKLVNPEQV
jgi:hypothetical protein